MTTIYDRFENPFNQNLKELGASLKEGYRSADPFPHCCVDNLISDELLEEVLNEVPAPHKTKKWIALEEEGKSHMKLISKSAEKSLGPHTKYLVNCLSSPSFLAFLEELTGIDGLIPDPYLWAAGLHQIGSGGFLEIHADFYKYKKLNLYRRLNLLLYLNKDWQEDYHGHLELWDKNMQKRAAYLPIWNRTLISIIAPHAYHGFPHPIQCPEDMTRKSLAIWYYTSALPEEVLEEYQRHVPNWIKRDHGNDSPPAGDYSEDHHHAEEHA